MDPKKKRFYIILASAAAVVAVGILIWSKMYAPAEEPILPITTQPRTTPAANPGAPANRLPGVETVYAPPAVFPQNATFNPSVLGQLKVFQNFQPAQINPGELGRSNPFNNY